jgi:ATP-dependent protease ClpP protease subunit
MNDDFKMLSAVPVMQPRRVITRSFTNQSTEYTIRITRPIGEIDEFEEEIMALEEATENDIVMIQLSSPGGSLETCDFLCRRINECAAPVFVEIGLTCASAASAMCLQADDWKIHDSSTMMVHACSYSPGYGKESDVRSSVENTARINKEWVERTYKGFLTDDELEKVLDGKDLYFYADDLRERLPAYRDFRGEMEQACDDPECSDCNQESMPSIDSIIEDAVASGVEKAVGNLLKKYELVERPKKPSRAKKPGLSENTQLG